MLLTLYNLVDERYISIVESHIGDSGIGYSGIIPELLF
jgi:hypothetical protein